MAVGGQPRQKVSKTRISTDKRVMLHICNPSCTGNISSKITVKANPGKNASPLSQKQPKWLKW
jgi:hypothetical protein